MALNLGRLRAFEAVTRVGSFTGAAQRLGVTPPAVSLLVASRSGVYAGTAWWNPAGYAPVYRTPDRGSRFEQRRWA